MRNGPLPNATGLTQTLSWGGFGPAPPTLAGSSSLLTTYVPSAMKNGKRMDDSTSSSAASANGGVGMRVRAVRCGCGRSCKTGEFGGAFRLLL